MGGEWGEHLGRGKGSPASYTRRGGTLLRGCGNLRSHAPPTPAFSALPFARKDWRAPAGRGRRASGRSREKEGDGLALSACSSSPSRVRGGADVAASRRGSGLERRSAPDRPAPPCPKWSLAPWSAPTRATGRNMTMGRSRCTCITASAGRWCWSWVSQGRDPGPIPIPRLSSRPLGQGAKRVPPQPSPSLGHYAPAVRTQPLGATGKTGTATPGVPRRWGARVGLMGVEVQKLSGWF